MKFGFGMKIEDLQLARKLVEDATHLRADEKEHVDVGGIYYQFLGPGGEKLTLVRNFDLYDKEPFIDGFDDWPVVLLVDEAAEDFGIVQALLKDPNFLLQEKR